MTTLTRVKFTDRGDQCWAVKDDKGAAEFRLIIALDAPMAITLHSADPVHVAGVANQDCDLLPGGQCWADCSFVGARDLYRAWVDDRRDDEVIWGGLESWHADRFNGDPEGERLAREDRKD